MNLEWDGLVKLEQEVRRIERDEESGEWPLLDEGSFRVSAGPISHRIPSFAFVIRGKDLPGRLINDYDLEMAP